MSSKDAKQTWLLILSAAGLLAGCYDSSRLSGDGSNEDDAAGDPAHDADARPEAPDAQPDRPAEPDDSTVPDLPNDLPCNMVSSWSLQPRQIRTVSLVDGVTPLMGVTERLLVEVQLTSGCEILGQLSVDIMPGDATDFVELSAFAWAPSGLPCEPDAPLVTRVVSIPGRQHGNMGVVVTDGNNPGGGLRLDYGREYCSGIPECQCWSGSPPGPGGEWSDCVTDCSCAAGLSCIGYWGVGGPLWSCARICADFFDCMPGEECIPPIPDGAPYVCIRTGSDQCRTADDCPPGFSCAITEHGSFCNDQRAFPADIPCACDAQCPAGQLCINAPVSEMTMCQVPCLSSSQCPNPEVDIYVCGSPAICVLLER